MLVDHRLPHPCLSFFFNFGLSTLTYQNDNRFNLIRGGKNKNPPFMKYCQNLRSNVQEIYQGSYRGLESPSPLTWDWEGVSQTRVRCKLDAYTACLKKRNSLVEKSAHDENIEREVSLYREVTLHVTQRCSEKNVVLFLREMTVSSEKQDIGRDYEGNDS